MSKKIETPEMATYEARELSRLRNSISFKLGIIITNLFKKPWRILLLPMDIFRIFSKVEQTSVDVIEGEILIIGMDSKGTYHSNLACLIKSEIKSTTKLHFLTTPIKGEILDNHTVVPGPKEMSKRNPKGWNLMIERYIATYLSNNMITKIILISDYPFLGVLNVIKSNSYVQGCWIKTTLPRDLDKKTAHAQSVFDLVIDSEKIVLSEDASRTSDRLPLQIREGRKNVVINLPNKLSTESDKKTGMVRKIIEENFEADIYQITYEGDKEIERSVPEKYCEMIDWSTVDLLICDGSIKSKRYIDNSDCHVICIPNKEKLRDRQIGRFTKKTLEEDIIVLSDVHQIAITDALENLLVFRPSKGDLRRKKGIASDTKASVKSLNEWIG